MHIVKHYMFNKKLYYLELPSLSSATYLQKCCLRSMVAPPAGRQPLLCIYAYATNTGMQNKNLIMVSTTSCLLTPIAPYVAVCFSVLSTTCVTVYIHTYAYRYVRYQK